MTHRIALLANQDSKWRMEPAFVLMVSFYQRVVYAHPQIALIPAKHVTQTRIVLLAIQIQEEL